MPSNAKQKLPPTGTGRDRIHFRKHGDTVFAIFPDRRCEDGHWHAYIHNYGWNLVSHTVMENTEPANRFDYAAILKTLKQAMGLDVLIISRKEFQKDAKSF